MPVILFTLLLLPTAALAETKATTAKRATWLKEAELPEGFPDPGPYGKVVKKQYPAYRAARTSTSGPNTGFWTLFRHIKKNEIAMTTPVEMTMAESEKGSLEMSQMAFLYEEPDMGSAGADGKSVQVVDTPPMSVLSMAWRGPRSNSLIAEYKELLLAEAAKRGLKGSTFRVLGYNSPSVPRKDRTHELQLILE